MRPPSASCMWVLKAVNLESQEPGWVRETQHLLVSAKSLSSFQTLTPGVSESQGGLRMVLRQNSPRGAWGFGGEEQQEGELKSVSKSWQKDS